MQVIVVGYDGSQHAKKALQFAKALSERFGSKVYVLYVVDTALGSLSEAFSASFLKYLRDDGERALREAKSLLPNAETKLLEGDPPHEIVAFAREVKADLIVVGSRGLSTIRRSILGSVASRLLQESDISVLVVK
ncbi:universal stress protein [Thermoproteus tenax]|nr:universal stress protein [Thermoproteus tenax]